MQEMKEINSLAFRALQEGRFDDAQQLFYSNAKRFPNHKTLNNLAVFYLSCGMRQKSGRVVSAQKLGRDYLKKALEFERSNLILGNIGIEAFDMEKYDEAYDSFEESNRKRKSFICEYNMAVCRYMKKEYNEVLKNTSDLCNAVFCKKITENGGSDPRLLCAFSEIYSGKIGTYRDMSAALADVKDEFALYDKFCALHLYHEYDKAFKLVDPLISEWMLDYSMVAMIAECCAAVAPCSLRELCAKLCEDSTLSKTKIKQIFNDKETMDELLTGYFFVPTLAFPNRWYL